MTNQAIPAWAVPGARVVCVKPHKALGSLEVTVNTVYTIRGVYQNPYGVFLSCMEFSDVDDGWYLWRFRPAVEPKSEAHDVALFEDIVRGMSLVERLDRIAETLDA